jgi:hypothetical protein
VVMKEGVKESSLNRRRQHDLPTPESPINSNLICGAHNPVSKFIQIVILAFDIFSAYQKVVIPCTRHDCLFVVSLGR